MASYDKGTAQGITKLAAGVYAVESFREEMKTYRVDLNANRCDCPHFSKRLADAGGQQDCKHMTAARAARFQQISETAKALPTERLEELKDKWFGQDKAIWLAIDGELHDRAQAEMKQSLLKQIFA